MNALKNWWRSVPKAQKSGVIVLALFIAAVLLMSFGVVIGASVGKAL
ncbi:MULTISPECIES: hypothetical protein [Rheinheimera]|nr:hypothetical protein [Rheinheimera aquimaris]MCB5213666.1 hypothetical protein [Rheinheimera aquimaris]MCD1598150.1 hypothetical protein [Rheinheimera aquimaris]|tara:strand:- start:418 stop:558 length:141 start_codon:yes stop_codon:yes gene_type:complete